MFWSLFSHLLFVYNARPFDYSSQQIKIFSLQTAAGEVLEIGRWMLFFSSLFLSQKFRSLFRVLSLFKMPSHLRKLWNSQKEKKPKKRWSETLDAFLVISVEKYCGQSATFPSNFPLETLMKFFKCNAEGFITRNKIYSKEEFAHINYEQLASEQALGEPEWSLNPSVSRSSARFARQFFLPSSQGAYWGGRASCTLPLDPSDGPCTFNNFKLSYS